MVAIKSLLLIALSACAMAAPAPAVERRQSCVKTCGGTCYYQSDIDAALNQGYGDLNSGSAPGGYPHQYNDYEGFSFPDGGPYYEFPILSSYKAYTGGSPGPDRVIFDSNGDYEDVITHTGASGDNFVDCN